MSCENLECKYFELGHVNSLGTSIEYFLARLSIKWRILSMECINRKKITRGNYKSLDYSKNKLIQAQTTCHTQKH